MAGGGTAAPTYLDEPARVRSSSSDSEDLLSWASDASAEAPVFERAPVGHAFSPAGAVASTWVERRLITPLEAGRAAGARDLVVGNLVYTPIDR